MGPASPEPVVRLVIPSAIFESMVAHCVQAQPNEACGMLAGTDARVVEIFKMTNIDESPVSYMMDPTEQFEMLRDLRSRSLSMVAIYHSHPDGPDFPSSDDIERAYYEEAVYIIVSPNENRVIVKGFLIRKGRISEVEIFVENA